MSLHFDFIIPSGQGKVKTETRFLFLAISHSIEYYYTQ